MCALQEVGKENLFVFGVDADDVPRLREERKNFKDYDPRWTAVMDLLLSGKFGDKEYFQVSCALLAARPPVQQLDATPGCYRMPLRSTTLHSWSVSWHHHACPALTGRRSGTDGASSGW